MNDWNDEPNDPWAQNTSQQHDPYSAPQQPHQAGDPYNSGLPQSSNGTLVLILGICSWLMCGVFTALPGWLIARGDRKLIQAGMMQPDSTLEAGYWINFISVIMTGLAFVLMFAFFFFAVIMSAAGSV